MIDLANPAALWPPLTFAGPSAPPPEPPPEFDWDGYLDDLYAWTAGGPYRASGPGRAVEAGMDPDIRLGDFGTRLVVRLLRGDGTVRDDLASAVSLTVLFRGPKGRSFDRAASLLTDGTDGTVYYETAAGEIDAEGDWRFYVRAAYAAARYTTEPLRFHVSRVPV